MQPKHACYHLFTDNLYVYYHYVLIESLPRSPTPGSKYGFQQEKVLESQTFLPVSRENAYSRKQINK